MYKLISVIGFFLVWFAVAGLEGSLSFVVCIPAAVVGFAMMFVGLNKLGAFRD